MLITQRAQARRSKQQMLCHAPRTESQPAVGQNPNEVSAGKKEHVARNGAGTLHYAVCPLAYLGGRFATRTAISKQLPVWAFSKNLGQEESLVFPVVPFHKVRIGFRHDAEPRQFASPRRTLQRAGKYLRELHAFQSFAKEPRVAFTLRRQRQVGKTRVLARDRPCRVTVPC